MPRAVEFRDGLPRSAVGKLLPKVLIAEVAEKANAAVVATPHAAPKTH